MFESRTDSEFYTSFSAEMIPRSTKMMSVKILKYLQWMSVIMIYAAYA